jgi:hypothetical protein
VGQLIQGGAFFLLGAGSFLCGLLAWRIWRGNRLEYDRNHERTGSVRKAIRGEISTVADGSRDYRVSAGIAVDPKTREWVEQGRLSTEAISAAINSPAS